jgi:hypothetical protein
MMGKWMAVGNLTNELSLGSLVETGPSMVESEKRPLFGLDSRR